MKTLLYKLFSAIFNISRILPVKKGRIALLAPHPRERFDSLGRIAEIARGRGGYEIIEISVPRSSHSVKERISFFLTAPVKLARSEYIFLNDNFMPLADLNISKNTEVIQLWHGEGAFKKFGILSEKDGEIKKRVAACSKKTDLFIVSSENVRQIYAEAFGADVSKIKALGSPRCDRLICGADKEARRESFDRNHPGCAGKKLILYAPTFRDDPEKDAALLKNTDFDWLTNQLGDEYALLIKLHPSVHSSRAPKGITDVTDEDINTLTVICDILITDYSSVCMNFAFLSKPCVFYAFDLDEYETERSFCFGYEDYVPGPVIKDYREIPGAIKNSPNTEKNGKFREFNFKYIDGNSGERVFDEAVKASSL